MDKEPIKRPTRFQRNLAGVLALALGAGALAAVVRGARVACEFGPGFVGASAGDMFCLVAFGMFAFVAFGACVFAIGGLLGWVGWAIETPVAEKPAAEDEDWR